MVDSFLAYHLLQNIEDDDVLDDEEDIDEAEKSRQDAADEYRRLIAIHAGKPKGGLTECLKVDPDKVRRLSLSELQLEKAAETHGKEIVRYCVKCCLHKLSFNIS